MPDAAPRAGTDPSTDAPPARVVPVSFSTVGLPVEQRIERWENHNEDALIGLRCRTIAGELEATEINVRLDRLHLARVHGTSHVVERDAALIRRRPTEAVALFFSLKGEAFFYHDDGVRTLRPGQMLVCDADRPFMRGFSRGLEELVVTVPHGLFTEVTGLDPVDGPRVVGFGPGADAVAHTLARTVGRAVRADDATPTDEATLLDLLAALTRPADRDPAAAHLAAARAVVEQHLADPGLSAESVAAAVGISSRHLSRVFAMSGTGFPAYVLGRRLDAARRILEHPSSAGTTVAEVARRCGFASATHFSGAFRSHVGRTPGEVRRAAATARSVPLDL